MQEHQGRRREQSDSEALAQRLDRLSRKDAERVLERAIRIQSQRHASDTLSTEQVKRIARELGLDDGVVEKAILEERRRSGTDEGEALAIPQRLVESSVVEGTPDEVEANVVAWMEDEEGLRAVARLPDGMRWVPDKHWLTSTRLALRSAGTKALRQMPEVVHRQRPVGPDEQLVELVVDTGRIRAVAWGVGGGLAALGVAVGAVTAAVVPGGNDLVQFAVAAVPGMMAGAATVVATARGWASSVRRGMRRALDGISHPELNRRNRRKSRRQKGVFQRLVDDVVDVIEDVLD